MSNLLSWLDDELRQLSEEALLRRCRNVRPIEEGRVSVDGREAWDFASNDYAGLGSN